VQGLDVLDARDRDPGARARLLGWLAVQRAFALAPQAIPAALREVEALAPWLRLPGVAPVPAGEGERLLATLARLGVCAVPIASPLYPARLRRLPDAPALLLVRGTAALLCVRAVAIVGARAATAYGLATARRLAFDLARAGLAVVSGLARGIDAAAHEGALEAGGATLAFQACGPDRVYPPAHRRLAERIAAQGAVLTEFPPGTPPLAAYFPLRNRLIGALPEAVVVVEGRERSGSLVTARLAADQGVDVLAVPGPVDSPISAGPHALVRDGAQLVRDFRDVLEALGIDAPAAPPPARAPLPGDPLLRAILRVLRREPLTRDALAQRLARPPAALAAPLLELELAGRLREDRDGSLRVLREPPRSPPGSTPGPSL
jgi:DNA processing protein